MNVNVRNIQLQLKAFNKALSRADKANIISNEIYASVSDLIDYERMTSGGYAKAGTKYLESMSVDELLAYSADIEQAKNLIEMEKILNTFDTDIELANFTDPKAALWSLKDTLEKEAIPFDYAYVREVVEGEKNIPYKDLYRHMLQLLTDKDYGLSDFDAWWNNKEGI